MADVSIKYKGNVLAEMSEKGTKTLRTGGKYCEDDISVIYTPSQTPVVVSDVTGTLDQSNNVLLEGNLPDGSYLFKYRKNDGTYADIGIFVLDNNVHYSVESNLTNCTNSNSEKTVIGGTSYNASIVLEAGYNLSSIVVTMGGVDVTASAVNGNNITIANITGDIVITAVAKMITHTNLAEPNTTNTTDFTIWCNQSRMGSDASYRQNAGTVTTNYMPLAPGDTIRVKGLVIDANSTNMKNGSIAVWYTDPRGTTGSSGRGGVAHFSNCVANGWFTISGSAQDGYSLVFTKDRPDVKFFRITAPLTGSAMDVIITRNEEIT